MQYIMKKKKIFTSIRRNINNNILIKHVATPSTITTNKKIEEIRIERNGH